MSRIIEDFKKLIKENGFITKLVSKKYGTFVPNFKEPGDGIEYYTYASDKGFSTNLKSTDITNNTVYTSNFKTKDGINYSIQNSVIWDSITFGGVTYTYNENTGLYTNTVFEEDIKPNSFTLIMFGSGLTTVTYDTKKLTHI